MRSHKGKWEREEKDEGEEKQRHTKTQRDRQRERQGREKRSPAAVSLAHMSMTGSSFSRHLSLSNDDTAADDTDSAFSDVITCARGRGCPRGF